MNDQNQTDLLFTGSIPEMYEKHLVPSIFQSYADDLAGRLAGLGTGSVLEVACGTGVVTRAIAIELPESATITATDLNQPMVDHAASIGTARPVVWRQADAQRLPFDDESFDAVVCQFGAMFFPDKHRAYAEMHRVLRPGGSAIFNVWDRLDANDFAQAVNESVAEVFPEDPPRFLERTPYSYNDPQRIRADLAVGGFELSPAIDVIDARSRAATCAMPALGFCQGSPLRIEIEARDPSRLVAATDAAAGAIEDRFGRVDIDGAMRALVVTAGKA